MNGAAAEAAIQPFSREWVEAAAALEREAGDAGWSRTHFEKELTLAMARFHIVTIENELVGYGGYWKIEDEAQITNLVVAPKVRRQGLGRRLLSFLLERARAEGCRRCLLEVREANDGALGLYRCLGFHPTGFRPGAYDHPFGDAVLMEKIL